MIAFFAAGLPAPQGNKTAFVRNGRAVLVEGRRGPARQAFADWRTAVRNAAAEARAAETITGPVDVELYFALPAPASLPKRRVTLAAKRPDVDKLARAVLDALVQAAVIKDDSQVVGLQVAKGYPLVDGRLGVWVRITAPELGDWTTDEWRDLFVAEVTHLATEATNPPECRA